MQNKRTVTQSPDKYIVEETHTISPINGKEIREIRVFEIIILSDGSKERGRMVQQHCFKNGELEFSVKIEDLGWDEFCRRYKDDPQYKAALSLEE